MGDHTAKHIARLATMMCFALLTGPGLASAAGPLQSPSQPLTQLPQLARTANGSCRTEIHTLQAHAADGHLLADSSLTVRATYTICPHQRQPSTTFSPTHALLGMHSGATLAQAGACSHPRLARLNVIVPNAISPNEIGTMQDGRSLHCSFNQGAEAEADVSIGPSYGTFRWWFVNNRAQAGYWEDNVYCAYDDGCDITGDMQGGSTYEYDDVVLYWQVPAAFYYAICT